MPRILLKKKQQKTEVLYYVLFYDTKFIVICYEAIHPLKRDKGEEKKVLINES